MKLQELRTYRCIDAGMIQDLVNVLRRFISRLSPGKPGRKKGVSDRAVRKKTLRIRELWATGRFESRQALARRLGCHGSTVTRALRAK